MNSEEVLRLYRFYAIIHIGVDFMGLFDIFRKKKVELTEEQLKWDKMWELWTEEKVESPYAELMTYQSEINNGGHSQYFCNVDNVSDLKKEMSALEEILTPLLRENLQKAYKADLILEEKEDEEAEEILDQCDAVFYENEEQINRILQEYANTLEI